MVDLNGKKYCLYLRRSKEYEGQEKYGISSQREFIYRMFGEENADCEFVDMSSAFRKHDGKERGKILEALEYCANNNRIFIVAYSSRLTRDYHFLSWFEKYVEKYEIEFKIAENPNQGRFELRLRIAFAQEESEEKSRNIRMGLQRKRETEGYKHGNKLFGTTEGVYIHKKAGEISGARRRKKSLEDPVNQQMAKLIINMRDKKKLSFAEIVTTLNDSGFKNKKGEEFEKGSVYYLYKRYPNQGNIACT